MKSRKKSSRSAPAPKTVKPASRYVLTPAEREIEAIRKRRRAMWRELGSLEAIEAYGAEVREKRRSLKPAPRKRSA